MNNLCWVKVTTNYWTHPERSWSMLPTQSQQTLAKKKYCSSFSIYIIKNRHMLPISCKTFSMETLNPPCVIWSVYFMIVMVENIHVGFPVYSRSWVSIPTKEFIVNRKLFLLIESILSIWWIPLMTLFGTMWNQEIIQSRLSEFLDPQNDVSQYTIIAILKQGTWNVL